MEHPSSPKSPSPSLQGSSPTSSPIESELVPISQELDVRKKKTRKKRKGDEDGDHSERKIKKTKKKKVIIEFQILYSHSNARDSPEILLTVQLTLSGGKGGQKTSEGATRRIHGRGT